MSTSFLLDLTLSALYLKNSNLCLKISHLFFKKIFNLKNSPLNKSKELILFKNSFQFNLKQFPVHFKTIRDKKGFRFYSKILHSPAS